VDASESVAAIPRDVLREGQLAGKDETTAMKTGRALFMQDS
jgi:hypothetical protein